jgi:hypothetical protein
MAMTDDTMVWIGRDADGVIQCVYPIYSCVPDEQWPSIIEKDARTAQKVPLSFARANLYKHTPYDGSAS